MPKIQYDKFLSEIYDDAPYFGQGRSRELDKFNAFYFDYMSPADPRVLEFGSGTGMLSIPLARAGFNVDSVDISPHMHDVMSDKLRSESNQVADNINQIVADATTFNGVEPYSSIVMPEGILIALPEQQLQVSLLESCHRNLKRGGRIYTDFFQPRYKIIYHKTDTEYTRFRTKAGERYLLGIHFKNDEYTQIQDWNVVFTKIENGVATDEVIEMDLRFRYVFYSEIQWMLKHCGFRVIDIDVNHADGRGFAVIAEKV